MITKAKIRNGWVLFKQAVVGNSDIDYTQGSIGRVTVLLAIPMILEMAMESVFAIVDIFFVSGLGTEAVAVVGLTEAVITLLYAIAMGLSMGATAMVARRIGEKNPQAAAVAAGQVMWIGLIVSVVIGLIGIFFAEEILLLMGAEQSVVNIGRNYTRLMFGGCFNIVFLFLINAVFRGVGDATIAMRALWLANGINIILDPCLIYGVGPFPELGVTGAGLATNIGRSIGVLYGLYFLLGTHGRIQLHANEMGIRLKVALSLLRISLGGIAQFLVAMASWVFLMQIVSSFGSQAVAGYTIAVRIIMFSVLPAWGLSNAAATLMGQNLGAGLIERAEKTTWKIAQYNTAYMAVAAVLILLFTRPLSGLFSDDQEVIGYALDCLRIFALGYVGWGFGMAVIQAFNGAGDTLTPTYINILCFWLVQVPLAYILALSLGLGPSGVFWAEFCAEILSCVTGVLVFRRGTWKTLTM
ncbi:MAG: MATE family efflux transporter [Gammaproteobacteria bacterium]|nr:MATE family efflux transporter [Gammaproteobacteria bacterium]